MRGIQFLNKQLLYHILPGLFRPKPGPVTFSEMINILIIDINDIAPTHAPSHCPLSAPMISSLSFMRRDHVLGGDDLTR